MYTTLPAKLFIGIDANRRPLRKISEKTYRKVSRGGLPNVLFVESAVEALPPELDGIAGEIYVNFPWGSLLRTVAGADEAILRKLRQLCAADALLRVIIGVDVLRDQSEIKRLGLPSLDRKHLEIALPTRYAEAGFEIVETREQPISNQQSANGKRLND